VVALLDVFLILQLPQFAIASSRLFLLQHFLHLDLEQLALDLLLLELSDEFVLRIE
jgi:hypothetical protein